MPIQSSVSSSRRKFLSCAAGGFAGIFLTRKLWSARAPIPVGIQLYTVKDDLEKDPAATLRKLAQIGYTQVEIAGFGKLSAAQFRDLIRAAGLHAPSAHLMFGMEDTAKLLDDAKTLGAEFAVSSVLSATPFHPDQGMQGFLKVLNTQTADDFKQTAAKANEIGQKAKAAGMRYAYHNHNFEFRDLGNGETGYDILVRETDPSVVFFEADCGWMKVAGVDPTVYLTHHPHRFVMLHIKDFKNLTKPVTTLMAPDAPTPTEIGRGSIDSQAIVDAGRKAGVQYMFVEQEPPFTEMTAMEAAAVDYTALKGLLAHS